MNRRELRRRKGAEFLAKQHPKLLVCTERFGDVTFRFEQLDQGGAGRLAKRGSFDRVAGCLLGLGLLRGPESGADPGDRLQ